MEQEEVGPVTPVLAALVLPAISLTVFAGLCVVWLVMRGHSAALLTPMPEGTAGPATIVAMIVGFGVAFGVASPLPRGLVRRLVFLFAMASSLYLTGESMRGLYAFFAFSDPVERSTAEMTVSGTRDEVVLAFDLSLPGRVIEVPASPETVAAVSRGDCADIPIERSASGMIRVARDAVLTSDDVGPCE